jgi:hypothetical protein
VSGELEERVVHAVQLLGYRHNAATAAGSLTDPAGVVDGFTAAFVAAAAMAVLVAVVAYRWMPSTRVTGAAAMHMRWRIAHDCDRGRGTPDPDRRLLALVLDKTSGDLPAARSQRSVGVASPRGRLQWGFQARSRRASRSDVAALVNGFVNERSGPGRHGMAHSPLPKRR